jgi:hypothetical protein
MPEQIVLVQDRHQSAGFSRQQKSNLAKPTPILIGAAKPMITLAAVDPFDTVQGHHRQILS